MANEHDHEYMHEHNIPHDHHDHDAEHPHTGGADHAHSHEHTHTHSHEHGHSHCPSQAAGCNSDCAHCDVDPKAELVALMQYMVNHNAAHANELAQLAQRLKDMGEEIAFEQVMQAVSDFEKGNMRLSTVLAAMNLPKQ